MVGIEADTRIIIAEGIVNHFTDMIKTRQIPLSLNREKLLKRLSEIKSNLMALKWSYKPVEQIQHSKELRQIEMLSKDIFDSFPPNWEETLNSRGIQGKQTAGLLNYIKHFFYSLRKRLQEGFSDDYADAFDIRAGEILSLEKVGNSIWKCLVTDGSKRYYVATNIPDLKKGEVVPIAILPPQIVHDVYSEGMFMGSSKGMTKLSKEDVGTKPDLSDKELGQARGIMEQFFTKKK
jgi:hypothetical protein